MSKDFLLIYEYHFDIFLETIIVIFSDRCAIPRKEVSELQKITRVIIL